MKGTDLVGYSILIVEDEAGVAFTWVAALRGSTLRGMGQSEAESLQGLCRASPTPGV
jgi:hypothetical protein